jgi:hypothetical protein
MSSPYLERPVRSLPQAIEEIARERGVPIEELYRQSGSAMPARLRPEPEPASLAAVDRSPQNT